MYVHDTTHLSADIMPSDQSVSLEGAPLFREADVDLGVYGVAQPTIIGLKTVLSVLRCQPAERQDTSEAYQQTCAWVCTREEPVVYVSDRPFVLREAHSPKQPMSLSDRAENLEAIEKRLKHDILTEAAKNNGLLLVHEEQAGASELKTMWVSVQGDEVRTVREVFSWIESQGWRVTYHRLPIAPDQPLEHNYLDAYTQVIKDTDPRNTCFVANCGAGVFRTTFAMIAAVLVRRRQCILLTNVDPMAADNSPIPNPHAPSQTLGRTLRRVQDSMVQNHHLLRLVHVLSHSFSANDSRTIIEQLLMHPILLKSLQDANMGDYGLVRQLCGLLDEGVGCKNVVDTAIDACAHVINLRESILSRRLLYSSEATVNDTQAQSMLRRASKALEVYYFLIAFASYVEESKTAMFQFRFASWLKSRVEIWRGIVHIRTLSHHLSLFDPVCDLSVITRRDGSVHTELSPPDKNRMSDAVDQNAVVTGDEFAEFVINNRTGMVLRPGLLLKHDIWREFIPSGSAMQVHGAVNFRRVLQTNIFGSGQPTVEGIHNLLATVLNQVSSSSKEQRTVLWINLREEPLVYVQGRPFCLRQRELSLRNITNYSGITPERLGQLEDRLCSDVISELSGSDGKLLLHSETEDGNVVPLWEDVESTDIQTVQGVMDQVAADLPSNIRLKFRRIPITAEKSVEYTDVADLLHAVLECYDSNAPIVVNCQLGRGRTTLVSVLILLFERWLQGKKATSPADKPRSSYHVINSLLRVIPHGQEIKRMVDDAIDDCGSVLNIRTSIEDAFKAAEKAPANEKKGYIAHGVQSLHRYFHLLVFRAFLDSVTPSSIMTHSFEKFVHKQPVLKTIARDLDHMDISTITPLGKIDIGDGVALTDEVEEVVHNRSGTILSASTILKSDFFSGILKAGLPLRIDGMPNLRRVCPLLTLFSISSDIPCTHPTAQNTWGCGMPTIEGLRAGLTQMGAAKDEAAKIVWTNLREEPVLYVNGRPHVLRLADQPLTNVEATGVTTDVVERMESALQRDLRQEARQRNGRVLLHDEVPNDEGEYLIVPVWETAKDDDILTPKEVYERMRSEGYRVDYARVAITDEQAPVPDVFSQLEERVQHAIDTQAICVFNCQMGRGRTTSGMIIASLIVSVREYGQDWLKRRRLLDTADASEADESRELREDELRMDGEYRCILQLVGVLSYGRLAKILLDHAIDRMDTIQNLRQAISVMKLRADSAEPHTPRHRQLMSVFQNYLARYGYLIAFASYLLDKMHSAMVSNEEDDSASLSSSVHHHPLAWSIDEPTSANSVDDFPSFPTWLRTRREITAILERDFLD